MGTPTKDNKNYRLWVLAIFAILSASYIFFIFTTIHFPQSFNGIAPDDFPNYYFGGKRLWNELPVYANLSREVKEILGFDYKAYPADTPFSVLILSIYSFFPYFWSWYLNIVISIALLILLIWRTCRQCEYNIQTFIIFLSVALISNPFLFLIKRNHYEIILGLLCFLGWRAYIKGQIVSGSIYWGLAASIKLFPLLWFFALPRYIGWRSFFCACFSFGLFSIIGILAVGSNNFFEYIFKIIPQSRIWYGTVGNYSLMSISYALNIPWIGAITLSFLALCLGLYLGFYRSNNFTSQWIIFTTLSLILSPLSWLNYLVIIIPLLLIVNKTAITNLNKFIWVFFVITIFFAPSDIVNTGHHWTTVLLTNIPFFGLTTLLFYTFFNRKIFVTVCECK